MAMNRIYDDAAMDGHDFYPSDFQWLMDNLVEEARLRLRHLSLFEGTTSRHGVASGMLVQATTDAILVGPGTAYDSDRNRLVFDGIQSVAVATGDAGKWLVVTNSQVETQFEAHRRTGVVSARLELSVPVLSLKAVPGADDVKLCKVVTATTGTAPTINDEDTNRDVLSLATADGVVANVPYVVVAGDGSGNFRDIQSALDALPLSGGYIFVKYGTYTLTTPLIVTKSNVVIVGSGMSTIITGAGICPLLQAGDGTLDPLQATGSCSNLLFSRLKFRLAADATGSITNLTSKVLPLVGTVALPQSIIHLKKAHHVTVRDCLFERAGGVFEANAVIATWGSAHTLVDDCFIRDVSGGFYMVDDYPNSYPNARPAVVTHCIMRGITGRGVRITDVWMFFNRVSKNIIMGSGASGSIGVDVRRDMTVSANVISNFRDGIAIGDGSKTRTNKAFSGIAVSGNVSVGNTNYGVESSGAYTGVVYGNNLRNNGVGPLGTGIGTVSDVGNTS